MSIQTWRTPAALVDHLTCQSGASMAPIWDGSQRAYACGSPCGEHLVPVSATDARVLQVLCDRQGWAYEDIAADPGERADLITTHVDRVRLTDGGVEVAFADP